jgi:hypothetical protein
MTEEAGTDKKEGPRRPTVPIQIISGKTTFWALTNGSYTECRSCGAQIGFAHTKKGKWVPFDPPAEGAESATPHWATCPSSKYYEKKTG